MDLKSEIFAGKDFSDLLKDIYDNSKEKSEQIKILIDDLRPLVKTISDATMLVPLLKDYIEVGVKNDDALVKMAAIVQRAMHRTGIPGVDGDSEFRLSTEDKEELYKIYSETNEADVVKETNSKTKKVIKDIPEP